MAPPPRGHFYLRQPVRRRGFQGLPRCCGKSARRTGERLNLGIMNTRMPAERSLKLLRSASGGFMTEMVQAAAPTAGRVSDTYRWTQLAVGVAAMVMIANYQYGWTFFV